MTDQTLTFRPATADDVPLILRFIRELAEYEKMLDLVVATEELLRQHLFGDRPKAEVALADLDGVEVGFALFFHNFSTFLGQPGIYLEDLYVSPKSRGGGVGKALLAHLAKLALERGCGRLEWSVLDWNQPAIDFYRNLGARQMVEWQVFRLSGDELRRLAE